MKKILAVATALVLAISSLCVFVVADSTVSDTFSFADDLAVSVSWGCSVSDDLVTFSSQWGEANVDFPSSVDLSDYDQFSYTVSDVTSGNVQFKIACESDTAYLEVSSNGGTFTNSSGYGQLSDINLQAKDVTNDCYVAIESITLIDSTGTNPSVTVTYPTEGYLLSASWGTSLSGSTVTFSGENQYNYATINLLGTVDYSSYDTITFTVSNVGASTNLVVDYSDNSQSSYFNFTSAGTYTEELTGTISQIVLQDPNGGTSYSVTLGDIILSGTTSTSTGTYEITFAQIDNGTVSSNVSTADAGDTVTLTVTPDSGYELKDIMVADISTGSNVLTLTEVTGGYTFTMPADGVLVNATFVKSTSTALTPVSAGDTVTIGGTSYSVSIVDYDGSNSTWGGNDWGFSSWLSDYTLSGYLTDDSLIYVEYTASADLSWAEVGLQFTSNGYGDYAKSTNTSAFTTSSTLNGVYFSVAELLSSVSSQGLNLSECYQVYVNLNSGSASSPSAVTIYSVSILSPVTGGNTGNETSNSVNGVIYVNEDYHGILITRNGRRHLLTVPHTVDASGYCTVCHEYIGSGAEVETVSINGGEYVEAYYAEVGINSENDSRWGSKDLGGTDLIEALAQDGAILVITRDGVSDTVFSDDGDFEKFGLVNAWWTGDGWVALGTAGHTSANEEGVVDCLSDDGTTVIYDGATVYAAWQALNLNTGSNTTIISNTSNSLSIVSVAVYVPADAVSVEEVEVSDPQESGETDSEDDGEDLTVDDSEPETPAETNPTTGAVLALVPMAIAGLAVVASKRR